MPRLEIEIGGSDKGGAAELQKTLGLLEELVALKKDLSVDLFKAETVEEIKLVGEMLTATNISIDRYINLASKATNVWKDNQTQTILDGLNTKMAVLTTNANLFGTSISNTQAQIRAYQSALDALIKNGLDPTDARVKSLVTSITQTTAALNEQKNALAITDVYSNLSTQLKQLETNVAKLTDAKAMGKAQIAAYQKAIDGLVKNGVDPASEEIANLQGEIRSLQAQMMNSEGQKNMNNQFQRTGALILDAQNKIRQLEQHLTMARSEASIAKLNRRLHEAREELIRLKQAGLDANQAMKSFQGGTNAAAIEVARIVQDAPYAANNIGSIGNNVTRAAELWGVYRENLARVVVAQGRAVTSMNIFRAAMTNMFTGANGYIMAISLLVTAFTFWQQWTQRQAREQEKLKDKTKELEDAIRKQIEAMDALSQARNTGLKDGQKEIAQVNTLRKAIEDEQLPREQRLKAVNKLKKEYPAYFKALKDDDLLAGNLSTTYDKLTTSLLNTALAQAAVKKAMELGEKVIDANTIVDDNTRKLNTVKKELKDLRREQEELVKAGAGVNLGGSMRQDLMTRDQVIQNSRLAVVKQQIASLTETENKLNEQNKTAISERLKAEYEIGRLDKQHTALLREGADVTGDVGGELDKNKDKIAATIKMLDSAIKDIYTSETDAGNLVGLEGLDKQIQQIDNKYNKLLNTLADKEQEWTETYKEQNRRKLISQETMLTRIKELNKQVAQERTEIEEGHFQEVSKATDAFMAVQTDKYNELEARAGRIRTASREKDLIDDRNYWDAKERELRKYNYTQKQWEEWRRISANNINEKWNAKDLEDTIAYQRRLTETLGQVLLRRLNKETELKVAAAKGDSEKLLKIQEEYAQQVRNIRVAELRQDVDLAFDGRAASQQIAMVNAELTLLKENFRSGKVTGQEFQKIFASLDTQRQRLELLRTSVDSVYASVGNLASDVIFDTDNALQNLGESFKSLAKTAVSELAKIGARHAINALIGKTTMASTTVASVAAAQTTAAAWSTAAAMVSAATFGASAVAGGTALAALIASSKALSLTGFSKGGYTGNIGRKEIAGVVHGQEFVVNATATRDNLDLLKAMNSGQDVRKFLPSSPKNANFGKARTSNQQTIKVEVDGKIDNTQISLSNSKGKRFERKFGRN